MRRLVNTKSKPPLFPCKLGHGTGLGKAYMVYSYACHIAEVEVDLVTGEASVEDYVAMHNSGRIINRRLTEGRVESGIA